MGDVMSAMIIDCRTYLRTEIVNEIELAFEEMVSSSEANEDGRPGRNAVRRYYRIIRQASGLPYVTFHHVEHAAENRPAARMVAFGRWV